MRKLTVSFYDSSTSENLNLDELAEYVRDMCSIHVELRGDFLTYHRKALDIDQLAKELARARVTNSPQKGEVEPPLHMEVEYERRLLENASHKPLGVIYDGFTLHALFGSLIPPHERFTRYAHIVFTDRLVATWDERDRRYHVRVIICGHPSIISTTGIVEGPAKPKEYYLLKRRYAMLGASVPLEVLKERFRGSFVDYDDPRLTDVMKGYVMQALFYHLGHHPFCEDKRCRLFNAHWQEEILRAQLQPPEFCASHKRLLAKIRQKLS